LEFIELLREIAENTQPDNSGLWIAVVSSASALFGALIGALLLYSGVVRQIESSKEIEQRRLKASIITNERLRWLQDIRQRHANLYTQLDMQYNYLKRTIPPSSLQPILDEFSKAAMEQTNMITNMLISSDPEQAKLKRSLQLKLKLMVRCFFLKSQNKSQIYDRRYALVKNVAFQSMEKIGINTWKKIKKLK